MNIADVHASLFSPNNMLRTRLVCVTNSDASRGNTLTVGIFNDRTYEFIALVLPCWFINKHEKFPEIYTLEYISTDARTCPEDCFRIFQFYFGWKYDAVFEKVNVDLCFDNIRVIIRFCSRHARYCLLFIADI